MKISGTLRAYLSKRGSGVIFNKCKMKDDCVALNRVQLALCVEGHPSDVEHVNLWSFEILFVFLVGDSKLTELLHQLVRAGLHFKT